tara:strand:- start:10485 stop:11393 length:909 start_codon:yes stop_codon:yes gene_type:complete
MKKYTALLLTILIMGCSNSGSDGVQKVGFTVAELDALKSLKNIKTPVSSGGGSSDTGGLGIRLSSGNLSSIGAQGSSAETTLDVSKFHENIHPFKYEQKVVSSNGELKALQFYSWSFEGKVEKYKALTAVDHNFSNNPNDINGIIWYQNFHIDNSLSEQQVYESHIVSYAYAPNHEMHYESDTFYIDDKIRLSRFELGSASQSCQYTVRSTAINSTTIVFNVCDLRITAYGENQTAHQFSGSLNNKSLELQFEFTEDGDINDVSASIVTNALFNTSGQQVGYFNLNLIDGAFTILDNNKQPI